MESEVVSSKLSFSSAAVATSSDACNELIVDSSSLQVALNIFVGQTVHGFYCMVFFKNLTCQVEWNDVLLKLLLDSFLLFLFWVLLIRPVDLHLWGVGLFLFNGWSVRCNECTLLDSGSMKKVTFRVRGLVLVPRKMSVLAFYFDGRLTSASISPARAAGEDLEELDLC